MVSLHHLGIFAVYIFTFNDLLNEQQQQKQQQQQQQQQQQN